jgi:GMP synthase (glutamine-hydrolysing)
MSRHQLLLILDFGSQYTQLIARRVRDNRVYCEVHPCHLPLAEIAALKPKAIVLSGGPDSVFDPKAPQMDPAVFGLGVPVLGICYGLQLIAHYLGGEVEKADHREYGRAEVEVDPGCALFAGLGSSEPVWMSHGDRVARLPEGFRACASSVNAPLVAAENPARAIWGIQFHPEVSHTPSGGEILRNFLFGICHFAADWVIGSFLAETLEKVREKVGEGRVLCAISGGVDSSVVAALLARAIGPQLQAVFVDTGLLRQGEGDQVMRTLKDGLGLPILRVNAHEEFLGALAGVKDPEQKRKIIGRVFIEVFEATAKSLGPGIRFLAQGTLYPDVIESVSVKGPSAVIKSHHNVGGLPERLGFELLEPVRNLFKDEVRQLGRELGIPEELIGRHPFPGPGLAVRILGEVSAERVAVLQKADAIFIEELKESGEYERVSQAGAVLLPVRSVGVMGDERTYEETVALRCVNTTDFMTADWSRLPGDLLARVSSRIVNEVRGVNRVVYDITSKPPGTIEWE